MKSSRSSKSSSDSYFANNKDNTDDSSNQTSPQQQYNSNTYRKPRKTTSDQSAKAAKPAAYVYGGQSHCSPERSYNTKISNDYENENDRFKTITLNSARRSFKNSYLTQTNADKAQYQPSWFVDVDPSGAVQLKDRQTYAKYDDNDVTPQKSSLRRKETFKVERKPSVDSNGDDVSPTTAIKTALNRKHTFRIDDRESSPSTHHIYLPDYNTSVSRRSRHHFEPIRVEIQSSVSERTGKTIPVGVTAPYRRRLNVDTTDSSVNRSYSPAQTNANVKINSSYSALNDIKENLAQLGRRQRYRSPSLDRSTTATTAITDRRTANVTAQVKPMSAHKYVSRCQVNGPSSPVRERETNVVRPRGRTVACSPRLRTAERSVSRDRRYNPSPIRQYDVRVVTTAGSMAYTSMRDKPLVRILKQPVTKPTDWTYNQVYL